MDTVIKSALGTDSGRKTILPHTGDLGVGPAFVLHLAFQLDTLLNFAPSELSLLCCTCKKKKKLNIVGH